MRIHLNVNRRHSKLAEWLKSWQISTTPIGKRWNTILTSLSLFQCMHSRNNNVLATLEWTIKTAHLFLKEVDMIWPSNFSILIVDVLQNISEHIVTQKVLNVYVYVCLTVLLNQISHWLQISAILLISVTGSIYIHKA